MINFLIFLILSQTAIIIFLLYDRNKNQCIEIDFDFQRMLNRLKKADKNQQYRKVFLMLRFQFNENERQFLEGLVSIKSYTETKNELYFKLLKVREGLPP